MRKRKTPHSMAYNKRIFASVILAAFILCSLFAGYYWVCADKVKPAVPGCPSPSVQAPAAAAAYVPPAVPAVITGSEARLSYLARHYWDDFPMRDSLRVHLPTFGEQALADYLDLLRGVPAPVRERSLSRLVDLSLSGGLPTFRFFDGLLERYLYNPNSPVRNELWYASVLRRILSLSEVSEAYKLRSSDRLRLILRNLPGSVAEDFPYTLRDGSKGRLRRFRAPLTLLLFFNPECVSCEQTLKEMEHSAVLARAVSGGKLSVLAIYADPDKELWQRHKQELPSAWSVGADTGGSILSGALYDLKAMPTLYLLDKDKKVLLKDKSWDEVETSINSLCAGE